MAIIDSNTAEQLFQGEDPIGKTIEYASTALVVIGVVEESNQFEPVINSIDDYYLYMSSSTSGKVLSPQRHLAPLCLPMTSPRRWLCGPQAQRL